MSIEEFPEMQDTTPVNYSQPGGHVGAGLVPHDHVYEDVKAAAAVAGIPQSEIADKCEFLEGELSKWLAADEQFEGAFSAPALPESAEYPDEWREVAPWRQRLAKQFCGITFMSAVREMPAVMENVDGGKVWIGSPESPSVTFTIPRSIIIKSVSEPLRILRLEVRELALALSTEMVEKKTAENRAGIYSEYVRLRGQLSDLHDFLKQHCDMELQRGQAQNLSLFDIVKTVILKDR